MIPCRSSSTVLTNGSAAGWISMEAGGKTGMPPSTSRPASSGLTAAKAQPSSSARPTGALSLTAANACRACGPCRCSLGRWPRGRTGDGWSGPQWRIYRRLLDMADPGPSRRSRFSMNARTASTTALFRRGHDRLSEPACEFADCGHSSQLSRRRRGDSLCRRSCGDQTLAGPAHQAAGGARPNHSLWSVLP